jgi:hypothetical protein
MFKLFTRLSKLVRNLRTMVGDCVSFFSAVAGALAAENLFLRKQLSSFPGTREESNANHTRRPVCVFQAGPLARLAQCIGDR